MIGRTERRPPAPPGSTSLMDAERATRHGCASGSAQTGACLGRVSPRAGRGGALRERSSRGRAALQPEMLLARGGARPPALRTEGVQVSVLPLGWWLPSRQGRGLVSLARHSVSCGALGTGATAAARGHGGGAAPVRCRHLLRRLGGRGRQVRWRSGRAAPPALGPVSLSRG